MDEKAFEQLQDVDWGVVGKELTLFAAQLARSYSWRTGGASDLARGETPEDVAREVIARTLEGVRRWDPAKGPLLPWLRWQVKSLMSHLADSAASRHETSLDAEQDLSIPGPEDSLLEEERRQEMKAQVQDLFEAVSDKPDLAEVIQAIMDGCEAKPKPLAAKLGTAVEDIDNRLRRLRRLAWKGVKP